MNYWQEAVEIALQEAGLEATPEQIDCITAEMESSHENYGMAHGYDAIPNPLASELEQAQRELLRERSKVVCKDCGGVGWIVTHGPYHSSEGQCPTCRGEGRVVP